MAPCPNCRAVGVRFASSPLQHHIRSFSGSRRRFCPACGKKWVDKIPAPRPPWLTGGVALLVVAAGINMVRSLDSEHRTPRRPRGSAHAAGAAGKSVPSTPGNAGASGASGKQGASGALTAGRESEAEAETLIEVDTSVSNPGLLDALFDIINMAISFVKRSVGLGSSDPSAAELEGMDKKMLWQKYGHYFGSKEEARKTYDDTLKKKRAEEARGQ